MKRKVLPLTSMRKIIFIFLISIKIFSQSNYDSGKKYFDEKKWEQAQRNFEKALVQNPNNYQAIEYLGDIFGHLKKWDAAIEKYNTLRNKFPQKANYWYKYGGSLGMKAKESNKFKALGMIDEIEESFLTAAKLDPKHTDVRWALLILYLELPGILGGSEKKAQFYANELMRISEIDGVMAKGHIEEYFKRYAKAEEYYKKGVSITHSKTAYQRLINLYKKMKLPEKVKVTQKESDSYNK